MAEDVFLDIFGDLPGRDPALDEIGYPRDPSAAGQGYSRIGDLIRKAWVNVPDRRGDLEARRVHVRAFAELDRNGA